MAGWDVAVLLGCLSLAAYLVLKRRRSKGRKRLSA